MFSNLFLENYACYEIMWKNVLELGRPPITIGRMHIACWIPKAAHTRARARTHTQTHTHTHTVCNTYCLSDATMGA